MNFWERLTRRYQPKSHEGQLILSRAYRAVFRGNPDRAQQQMVLADLAARCGWVTITSPQYVKSSRELWYREGKRAAYAEIFKHLSLGPDDVTALENAARHEVAALDTDDVI